MWARGSESQGGVFRDYTDYSRTDCSRTDCSRTDCSRTDCSNPRWPERGAD